MPGERLPCEHGYALPGGRCVVGWCAGSPLTSDEVLRAAWNSFEDGDLDEQDLLNIIISAEDAGRHGDIDRALLRASQEQLRETPAAMSKPLPRSPEQWFEEILLALQEARDTKPFGLLAGVLLTEGKLFHLAPHIALKFRGMAPSEKERARVTEAALAHYVVHTDPAGSSYVPGLSESPEVIFALCYVAAHVFLNLLEPNEGSAVMSHSVDRFAAARPRGKPPPRRGLRRRR